MRGKRCGPCSARKRARIGSRHARGYGSDWVAFRAFILRRDRTCQSKAKCEGDPSREVDHKVPFKGLADPLRLDPDNCRGICVACHRHKSVMEDGGFGRRRRAHA